MIDQNIVCFGPTNSGKSTLAGYLSSHKLTDEEYAKEVQQFRTEYGKDFLERRILSYFVDSGKDEYRVQKHDAPGTSKRKHITEAVLENDLNCTLIDTPGTDKRWRSGFQGIYLGDIGIFIIEITTLLDLCTNHIKGSYEYDKILNRLLVPVSLWEKYGRLDRLIIVISKMDLCRYSKYLLARAEKVLKERQSLKNVPIIPIAINVKQRSDVNVFSESGKFPNHKSLFSALKNIMGKENKLDISQTKNRFFAAIDKRFDKTLSTGEAALRVKVLDGNINVGTSVMIGPVRYNDQIGALNGSVRSLMCEANRRHVSILTKNHIGGVIFSRLQNGRDVLSLKDIELLNTSILMDTDTPYDSGNFLKFTLKDDPISRGFFKTVRLNTDIKLIWFGKIEVLRIISFVEKGKRYQLCLMNTKKDNYPFYLPKDNEGNLAYKDYVLQYKDSSDNETFIQARLNTMVTISDDNRKDVAVSLKTDYSNRLSRNVAETIEYIKKDDLTVFTIRNMSSIELTDFLFNGDIDKTDILDVAPKKYSNVPSSIETSFS